MPIDRQVQVLLDQMAEQPGVAIQSLSPGEARAQMELATKVLGPGPSIAIIEDRHVPGPGGMLRIRIISPGGDQLRPGLVYFHGGGWVIGSIETHDALCRSLAHEAGVVVVSVDYRLAPENPYPAAVDDAYEALVWVAAHAAELGIDASRIAVGGDSAGGNLAAVCALRARDRGTPSLAFQLLIYPITDCDLDTRSYLQNAQGYMLTRDAMAWFWNHYVPDPASRLEPNASPLRAPDLSGLPPALVISAEYDPLCDEAEAYASRLAEAGVSVKLTRYNGMIHGFLRRHNFLDQGRVALHEASEALRTMLPAR